MSGTDRSSETMSADARVLWIDLGGVLFQDPRPMVVRRLCAQDRLDPRRLGPAYYRLSRALDLGAIDLRAMHERLRRDFGVSIGYRGFHRLVSRTSLVPVRPVLSALRRLRASAPVRILITSNVSREVWLGLNRSFAIGDAAHGAVLSFQVRALKPSASFFRVALRRGGVPADRVLFLDDSLTNVRAARRVGVRAHRVTGGRDAVRWLRTLAALRPEGLSAPGNEGGRTWRPGPPRPARRRPGRGQPARIRRSNRSVRSSA